MSDWENFEPKKVFSFFEEISHIPRGSGNTKAISDYLVRFARERGLIVSQDAAGNVVIIQEASEGYEDREPVILQGHMDMVCEKESGCEIDFEKDPLELYMDGDFLRARGTTLGADDGIAVAYALALLDSPQIAHPRLEVVLTVDEEIGMLGAAAIDLSMLRGRRMLNIDSEKEGEFLTSCAGGMTLEITIPMKRTRMSGRVAALVVEGLLGGHSGDEIDKERANGLVLMGRALRVLSELTPFWIISLTGGGKDNAIPREAKAKLLLPEQEEAPVTGRISRLDEVLKKEFAASDPGVSVRLTFEEVRAASVTDRASTEKAIAALRVLPNGVQHMSREIRGLVETSLNLGILELREASLRLVVSIRSSVASRKEELRDRVCHLVGMLGGEAEVFGDYPAWEYRRESPLREQITEVWEELFGKPPVYSAIHAGLECGIFSEKLPGLDCVSFGPDNFDIHTPKERLDVQSAARVWEFLVTFLGK